MPTNWVTSFSWLWKTELCTYKLSLINKVLLTGTLELKWKKQRRKVILLFCSVFALAKIAVTSSFMGNMTQLLHRSRIVRIRCQLGHPVSFMETSLASSDFHKDVILVLDWLPSFYWFYPGSRFYLSICTVLNMHLTFNQFSKISVTFSRLLLLTNQSISVYCTHVKTIPT